MFYVHGDDLNNVTKLSNAGGFIAEYFYYDDFGTPESYNFLHTALSYGASEVGNPFFFQGRPYNAATDLYNFRARWYSPETGRFIQRDPLGHEWGIATKTKEMNSDEIQAVAEIMFKEAQN